MANIGRYLLNTNSQKIHDTEKADGRCRINKMRPEFIVYFNTLEEAKAYPNINNPMAKTCRFCINE